MSKQWVVDKWVITMIGIGDCVSLSCQNKAVSRKIIEFAVLTLLHNEYQVKSCLKDFKRTYITYLKISINAVPLMERKSHRFSEWSQAFLFGWLKNTLTELQYYHKFNIFFCLKAYINQKCVKSRTLPKSWMISPTHCH